MGLTYLTCFSYIPPYAAISARHFTLSRKIFSQIGRYWISEGMGLTTLWILQRFEARVPGYGLFLGDFCF